MASQPPNLFSAPLETILSRHRVLFSVACFSVMALSNVLLSYFDLSITFVLWVLLGGILLPFLAFLLLPTPRKNPPPSAELFTVPNWVWGALALAAVGLRFFSLTTLSTWPVVDEGNYGFFATLLEEKWNWHLVHGFAQEPSFYMWGQFVFFKLFGNSPLSLWLFPAVCSALCVPFAWLAARKARGPSTGFFTACFMGLGFWPLYIGRFSTPCVLMFLWECVTFCVLASYFKKPKGSRLVLLGFLVGMGFYIYLAWAPVAFMVTLALGFNGSEPRRGRAQSVLVFSAVALAVIIPLVLAMAGDYRGYFNHLWPTGSSASWRTRLPLGLAYLRGIFWGTDHGAFSYGPLWGGLFNPLLSALIFLGAASLLRASRSTLSLFLLGSAALFSLPAVLTNSLEMMRLTALLPILIGLAATGAQSLLSIVPQPRRIFLFALIVLSSLCLDLRHLYFVYPVYGSQNTAFYGAHKTVEFERAYPLLKSMARSEGPGLILLNFHPDPYDQTLFVATYSFNAAENRRLDLSQAKWTAVLANIHEQPYLARLFPGGRWTWVSEGLGRKDGGFLLEITPVTPQNRGLLLKWQKADQSLGELTRLIMEWGVDPDQGAMMAVLEEAYPWFKGDPLLESRYWRIRSLHHAAAGQIGEAVLDTEKALSRGRPMAQLYNDLGCLLFSQGKLRESQKAFEKALYLRPNCTDAAINLQSLLKLKRR